MGNICGRDATPARVRCDSSCQYNQRDRPARPGEQPCRVPSCEHPQRKESSQRTKTRPDKKPPPKASQNRRQPNRAPPCPSKEDLRNQRRPSQSSAGKKHSHSHSARPSANEIPICLSQTSKKGHSVDFDDTDDEIYIQRLDPKNSNIYLKGSGHVKLKDNVKQKVSGEVILSVEDLVQDKRKNKKDSGDGKRKSSKDRNRKVTGGCPGSPNDTSACSRLGGMTGDKGQATAGNVCPGNAAAPLPGTFAQAIIFSPDLAGALKGQVMLAAPGTFGNTTPYFIISGLPAQVPTPPVESKPSTPCKETPCKEEKKEECKPKTESKCTASPGGCCGGGKRSPEKSETRIDNKDTTEKKSEKPGDITDRVFRMYIESAPKGSPNQTAFAPLTSATLISIPSVTQPSPPIASPRARTTASSESSDDSKSSSSASSSSS